MKTRDLAASGTLGEFIGWIGNRRLKRCNLLACAKMHWCDSTSVKQRMLRADLCEEDEAVMLEWDEPVP